MRISDWSSDVCSSDLIANGGGGNGGGPGYIAIGSAGAGSLTVSEGALVDNAAGGYTFVGLEVGSTGEPILQGDAIAGALFDHGEALVVGAGYNVDTGEVLIDRGGTGSATRAHRG